MTNKDDAVYPSNYDNDFAPEYGLTKREYFAAMAMQGFLAADAEGSMSHDNCAKIAVMQADALLEELSK